MPSARRNASPSMWYRAVGCTTAREDHAVPCAPDKLAISCGGWVESGQKRHADSVRGAISGTSSPVMTQERVMGSLRSSMPDKENTREGVASTVIFGTETAKPGML